MGSQIVDVRLSTLPTGSGERVVLRILGKQNQLIKIDKLNMPQVMLDNLTDIKALWFAVPAQLAQVKLQHLRSF